MKILAIRGKNLASLEAEFDIDFTCEPLKSSGIFAITGNTGAGKSTILDALCLALFDNAPRLKDAEQVEIADTEDKTITQRDSRNLLRRGAGEGFAEVDFIALNGDTYRSRWSVKRARGRADGALQATAIMLENLSSSVKEQGTKTELLKKITEMIGLTFHQFTRSVLLAQNDFSTFLKSKQNEKAELLEKLTGTEIYSRISSAIYKKTGEAKEAFVLTQKQMEGILLFPEEEMEAFLREKTGLELEIIPLKNQQSVIGKKLEWLSQETLLKGEAEKAEQELARIDGQIREAHNRYEYIRLSDLAQEIRDTYFSWKQKRKQSEESEKRLAALRQELENMTRQSETAEKGLATAKEALAENEKQYSAAKPEMDKAKETDIRIQSAGEKVKESREEFEIQERLKKKTEEMIDRLQEEVHATRGKIEEQEKWFTGKEAYRPVVARIEFLTTLLDDILFSQSQTAQLKKNLSSNRRLLESYLQQLEREEVEAQRLDELLPSEIIRLRSALEEGKACPVCGSMHHPAKDVRYETGINEKELNAAKERAARNITTLKEKIENARKETDRQDVLVQNYRKQYEDATVKAGEAFVHIPGWQKELEKGQFPERLKKFAGQWNEYEEQLTTNRQNIEILNAKLEAENNNLQQILEAWRRKKEVLQNDVSVSGQLIAARKLLLGGRKAEDVEAQFLKKQEECTQTLEAGKAAREKLEKQIAEINGTLSQVGTDYDNHRREADHLYGLVDKWSRNPKHPVTWEWLDGLMSKPTEWIAAEKKYLSELDNRKLILTTSLEERRARWQEHMKSANKPEEGQNRETLEALAAETNGRVEQTGRRLTEIEVNLSKQRDGLARMSALEKEMKEKQQLYEDWAKLNDLLGSSKGDKFKAIAQGYTLDVLLGYANKHLEDLTKRYKLEKVPETLSLQVIDNDMLGEVRTVHSLSGGESFLISLSLALGLSSLSSNRMKIESLFIDEGFGSLDIDTLSVAMNALENLQTQGRKIGVISHVEEMKERIATRIQVVKSANGKSYVKVVNSL